MQTFSSGQVCEVAGISMATLDKWLASGYLGADRVGQGRGRQRHYSVVEILAIAAGVRWRNEGATPGRVAALVRFVSRWPLERLEAEFARGRTLAYLPEASDPEWPGLPGFLVELPRDEDISPGARELMRRCDLERIWKEVHKKIKRLPPPKKPGPQPKVKRAQGVRS